MSETANQMNMYFH